MNHQDLQYFMHDEPASVRFELAGYLDGETARRVDRDWRRASGLNADKRLIVDITFVTSADDAGRDWLAHWQREGARLVAGSETAGSHAPRTPAKPSRPPFFAAAASLLILLLTLVFPSEVHAATLRSETVEAWDAYVQTANANLRERVRPGGCFLWTFENPARAEKVRRGEIVIAPTAGPNPRKVPGGLIHHWIGAVFVPNLKIDQILDVTRDYDHYKDFFSPSVVDSKLTGRNGLQDRFTMLLMNKAFFLKTALDADYRAKIVRLDDHRAYSVSWTTRVQEIEEYGRPDEHKIPEGEGGGYIWKLYSVARLEERDGGVYIELEASVLSREIPAALRFFADPIVRRVSRNSLFTSLQQTEDAVLGHPGSVSAPAIVSADAGQFGWMRSTFANKSSVIPENH